MSRGANWKARPWLRPSLIRTRGEVLVEAGTVMTRRPNAAASRKRALPEMFEVELPPTTRPTRRKEIIDLFVEPETIVSPGRATLYAPERADVEVLEFDDDGTPALNDDGTFKNTRARKRVPYAAVDVMDANGKPLVRAYDKIERDTAKKIEALGAGVAGRVLSQQLYCRHAGPGRQRDHRQRKGPDRYLPQDPARRPRDTRVGTVADELHLLRLAPLRPRQGRASQDQQEAGPVTATYPCAMSPKTM